MPKIEQVDPSKLLQDIRSTWDGATPLVFDCDGTLIRGDIASLSAWALIRLGLAHAEILPPEWDQQFRHLPFDYSAFRVMRNLIIAKKGISAIYEWETYLHAGLPPTASLDVAKFATQEGLKQGSLALLSPVSDLAKEFKDHSWICSGSPDVCVWAIADLLEISRDRVVATRLETVDGIQAPRILAPGVVWEGLKLSSLQERGVTRAHLVAGDTIGDWAMMDLSSAWRWCVAWGDNRHRGQEFRDHIQNHVLGTGGPSLPAQPGHYLYRDAHDVRWVFQIL